LYCEDDAPKSFIDPDFILHLLSEDQIEGKEKYRLLLKQGSELEAAHVLEVEEKLVICVICEICGSIFAQSTFVPQITQIDTDY
jgi:hypothetical protein